MKEKSIKKNYIFNTCYQILLIIVPFITTPYLSRVLGVDGVGLYSFASSIVAYFTVFACLGTGTYGQRAISYVADKKEERSRVFFETFIFRLTMTLITLVFYGIYLFFVKENFIIYIILSLNILNIALDISWFLYGMEEFQKTVIRSTVFKILNIVFIFVFIKKPDDLTKYILGTMILNLLSSFSLWIYVPKYVERVNGLRPFKDIKTIIRLFIPTIAIQIYTLLDKSMIGVFASDYAENGYYEQAEKVTKICLTLVTSLGTVMIPRIGKTFKEGNFEKIRNYMYKSYNFIWFLAIPIMFGLMAIASIFVPIFFGDGYEKVAVILPILSVIVVFIGLSNVNGFQYFVPIGKENVLTLTVVIGAVVNLILNLFLIPRYYAIGACIASVIAEGTVTAVGFIYMHNHKELSIRKIIKLSINYFISGVVMFASLLLIKSVIGTAIYDLVLLIGSGVVIYILMLFILKDSFFLELFKLGIGIVKKKLKRE